MFQTSVLVSGSKGNAILVRTGEAALLLDSGVAARNILAALDSLGVGHNELQGVIVSHEHSDHTRGVGALARKLRIPLYINEGTLDKCESRLGDIPAGVIQFETGSSFSIRDLVIHPFSSPHDAADSCNFTFTRAGDEERKLGVATDLGFPSTLTLNKLKRCTTLVLESNHDERMLMDGPYDWALKQRIKSNIGHLSNLQAVGMVSQVMHHGLQNLVLAHLSETNNDPQLALETMRNYLETVRSDIRLLVAGQNGHTPLLDI
ncbi:MAG TPA: MBL fold metallo-hydrolase [Candidatus Syntrophosphaera sp.]|nr:MBL fold metallo-hydrolase [Candidatus Syntrophosphaera sp.]HRT59371.1 MBL fold metallo-hydrolase [Candidatus Syntrophosphaera sp.]